MHRLWTGNLASFFIDLYPIIFFCYRIKGPHFIFCNSYCFVSSWCAKILSLFKICCKAWKTMNIRFYVDLFLYELSLTRHELNNALNWGITSMCLFYKCNKTFWSICFPYKDCDPLHCVHTLACASIWRKQSYFHYFHW